MKKSLKVFGITAAFSLLALGNTITSFAGWESDRVGKYYITSGTNYYKSCWKQIDNYWYNFNSEGYVRTGWYKDPGDNNWYYLDWDGKMKTGWIQLNNVWYYLDKDGRMQTGWIKLKDDWYYLNSDGSMKTGFQNTNGKWYLLDNTGKMLKGWQKYGGNWYYLDKDGVMVTGQQKINGGYFLFDASGRWIDSSSDPNLLSPSAGEEPTTELKANMTEAQVRGLATHYYDKYYNEIQSAFAQINELRPDGKKFNFSKDMTKAALCQAIDMMANNYFAADNPSTSKTEWNYWGMAESANVDNCIITQNNSLQNVLRGINEKSSKNAYDTIRDQNYTTAGVGFVVGPNTGNNTQKVYLVIMLQK